jgi:tripartite-type tricarboxylate transporter receptor subunit TctC
MFNNPVSALPQVKAGKVRAIATTGLQRSLTTPDVPTVAESGYLGFEAGTWFAMLGPAGIPRDVVGRLSADLVRVLNLPEVRQRMAVQGVEAVPGTPEQLGATMRADLEKWTRVIRAGNIRPD